MGPYTVTITDMLYMPFLSVPPQPHTSNEVWNLHTYYMGMHWCNLIATHGNNFFTFNNNNIVFKHPVALLHSTYDNTVPSQCNYLLSFTFTFPFRNMFRPQPAIIRCFTLSKLLYYIESYSFTSHARWCFIIFNVIII
jgi:hypothetical protein